MGRVIPPWTVLQAPKLIRPAVRKRTDWADRFDENGESEPLRRDHPSQVRDQTGELRQLSGRVFPPRQRPKIVER